MDHHFIVCFRRGPAWAPMHEDFEATMRQHLEFLVTEHAAGRLLMAGPMTDETAGVAVFRMPTRSDLFERLQANAAVAAGLVDVELHGWMPWDFDGGIDVAEVVLGGDESEQGLFTHPGSSLL